MPVFSNYAKYYNLIYQNKDYKAEAGFIDDLIQKHTPKAKTILNLGCGTGRHDSALARKGYSLTGVDMSKEMLAIARNSINSFKPKHTAPDFHYGDIRSIRLDREFDVVTSLFHVMSYQTTNSDLHKAFKTAAVHLNPGGIFIFDCWYGPGVLSDPPAIRTKELEDHEIAVTRIARPKMHLHKNIVDVNYHISIRDKKTQQVEEVHETHSMRYLFYPEVENMLQAINFKLLDFVEFMKDKPPKKNEWNVCFICRKPVEAKNNSIKP